MAINQKIKLLIVDDSIFFRKALAGALSGDQRVEVVGQAVGGVCPFGINEGVAVYLDSCLRRFETVFPACGSNNSAIELTIPELEAASRYIQWVDVCKNWTA